MDLGRCRSLCRRLLGRIYRPYVLWRISRPSEARIGPHRLRTDPEVFHPVFFHSSGILVAHLARLPLRGRRLLDMGTGAGPVAVFAAAAGALVTACDVNPRARALAEENLRRNHLPGEVLESDLFAALSGRTFDLIVFNIPFYPGQPRTPLDAAFFAGNNWETVETFARGCATHLDHDGHVVIIFSEDSDHVRILALFAQAGLAPTDEVITRRFFEQFHIVTFRHRR